MQTVISMQEFLSNLATKKWTKGSSGSQSEATIKFGVNKGCQPCFDSEKVLLLFMQTTVFMNFRRPKTNCILIKIDRL